MKAIVKLREIKRPVSEETIAFRLVAAIPNAAAPKGKVSFRAPYFISESTDNSAEYLQEGNNYLDLVAHFENQLRWQGFTEISFGS